MESTILIKDKNWYSLLLGVDTGEFLLAAHVGPAHENERVGGQAVLKKRRKQAIERLQLVLADAGYGGQPLA